MLFSLCPAAVLAQSDVRQDVSPNVSVSDRFNQNFGVEGVRSGSFVILPRLGYRQTYNDNIFALSEDEVEDYVAEIDGAAAIRSDWSAHELEVSGLVRRRQYFENDTESTTDYTASARGIFDFNARSYAALSGGHSRLTEARRALQTANGAQPVRFSVSTARIDFDFAQTRFREQFGFSYRREDFDDAINPADRSPIDQDFRDSQTYSVFYRQSFRVRPAIALFAQVRGAVQEFDQVQPGVGFDQDSRSYSGSIGVAFDINKVARGEIGVGYQARNFDSAVFEDIDGLNADASLEYFLSDLTTVTVGVQRQIQATAVIGVAGLTSTEADLKIEHELLRPLLLVADASYRVDDLRGLDRQDNLFRFSAGVDYAFRRNVVLRARFTRNDVTSSGELERPPFTENIAQIGIELRR